MAIPTTTTRAAHVQTGYSVRARRIKVALPAYYRVCERRWRNASFYLVERRRGKAWMYGSVMLATSLWTYLIIRLSP